MPGVICKLEGEVVQGEQLGSKIGFPTVNVNVTKPKKISISKGVYGVVLFHCNNLYYGVMNYGRRPTVSNKKTLTVEVHVFDFQQIIYNDTVEVHVMFFVRPEQNFLSVDALKQQIHSDVTYVKKRFTLHADVKNVPDTNLPDRVFCRLLDEQFGINKGVYNTIDTWFWTKGINQIERRRETVIDFLRNLTQLNEPSRKLKFGTGGLTHRLETYWDKKHPS